MFTNKIKHFTYEEVEYPLFLSAVAMGYIQNKYGYIDAWTKQLINREVEITDKEGKVQTAIVEPLYEVMIYTVTIMINEGIRKENKDKSEHREYINEDQAGELIMGYTQKKMSEEMYEAIILGMKTESKNAQATQS